MCAMQRLIVWLEKRWISDIDGCCNKRQPALNLWSSLAASKAHRIMQACWLATVMACWSITCSPLRATTFSDSMTSVPSICHFTSSIAWAVHGPYSISCCHSGLVQLPSPCSATDIVAMQFRSTVCTFGRKQECRCPHRASLPSSTIPNVFKLIVSPIRTDSLHCIQHTRLSTGELHIMLYVQFNLLHCTATASSIWSFEYLENLWSKSVQLLPLTWLGKGFHSFGRTTLDYLDYLDSARLSSELTLLLWHASLWHRSKKSSPRTMGLLHLTITTYIQT